jgi:hypothetical protein
LDSGPLISKFNDGGLFDVSPGTHTLRGFIGDASGKQIIGTTAATVTFKVT